MEVAEVADEAVGWAEFMEENQAPEPPELHDPDGEGQVEAPDLRQLLRVWKATNGR